MIRRVVPRSGGVRGGSVTASFSGLSVVVRRLMTVVVLTSWTGWSTQAFLTSSTTSTGWWTASPAATSFSSSRLYTNQEKNQRSSSAQDLIEKAARIRAEIAVLEGKTIQQVEQEAVDKKRRENAARDTLAQQRIATEAADAAAQRGGSTTTTERLGRALPVPSTRFEMVQQCARAVERAMADGRMRQTVRFALLESEEQTIYDANNNMWPGGAAQMSRQAAKPTTQALFRELRLPQQPQVNIINNKKNTVVTVEDVWDFDGSAMVRLLTPSSTNDPVVAHGPDGAAIDANCEADNGSVVPVPAVVVRAQALVLANTDVKYTRDIQSMLLEQQQQRRTYGPTNESLILLVNPFWRDIDSWGINILAPGAKRLAQEVIFHHRHSHDDDDNNNNNNDAATGGLSDETYSCRRFQCRGEECIAIKAYPYDWQIFAYWEGESPSQQPYSMLSTIRLGECKDEPKTDFVTNLLNQRPEFKLSRTMRQMKR